MATRATITVADDSDSFDIYQHYDGYPDGEHGMVRRLAMAPRMAWKLPRCEAMDFAAAVISVLKEGGGTTYLTKDAELHSDREFHYKITPLRDGVSTRVGLTITQAGWPPGQPDKTLFDGDINDAIQKFNAIALAPNTLRRIARGIQKYVIEAEDPFFVTYGQHGGANRSAMDPLHTITASKKDQNCVVVPQLMSYYGEGAGGLNRAQRPDQPLTTLTTANRHALVTAFIAQHNTGVIGRKADAPLSTITTTGAQQNIVAAHLMNMHRTTRSARDTRETLNNFPYFCYSFPIPSRRIWH